jgi:HD-like signal output (HDOD) protein
LGIWNLIKKALSGPAESPVDSVSTPKLVPFSTETNVALLDPAEVSYWFTPQDASALEPVPMVRPELSHEARTLENMLISQFDGYDMSLPSLPRVPDLVLKQLRDPKCSFPKIAQIISEDQVSAATVLRTVNSPIYCGLHKITSLPQAVARLGINAMKTLMMHQSLRAATFLCGKGNREMAQTFWRRSLAGAYIMRGLSDFARIDPEDALATGLLHDIGNVIVLRVVSEEKTFGLIMPDRDILEYLCYETHQEFGELVAKEWNMAPQLKELIQNHHTYPNPDDPLRTERLLLILSDMISQMLGYAPPALYNLLQSRPVNDLGLADREDFHNFLKDLPGQIDESINWF